MSRRRVKIGGRRSRANRNGYILLSVMLVITLMLIVMATAAPRIAQQIKRDKEEEMLHRGKEYAIAIKRFYHKNGTYPVSLDQLENTNNIRFLRHRFKDPMTEKGDWKLVHVGEAQIKMPGAGGAPGVQQGPTQTGSLTTSNPGSPFGGTQPGVSGLNNSAGGFGSGGLNSGGLNSGGLNSGGLNSGGLNSGGLNSGGLNSGGLNSGGLNSGGLNSGGTSSGGLQGTNPAPGGGGQLGTLATSNIGTGLGANAQGGGPIIGVVSTSDKSGIKEFNGSGEYDQWMIVYDPRLEAGPGAGGVTVAAPTVAGAPPTAGMMPAGVVAAPAPAPGSNQPGAIGTPAPNQPGAMSAPTPPQQQQQPMPTPTPQTIPQ